MAGTLFGLGLSQRVDANGKPDIGWLLYLYSANSSTPVTAYSDTALTIALPWPLEADASGMMPGFWLADGSYRARGTSADASRTFFDNASILAVGASAGSAPSGGVDATTIFATGDIMFQPVSGTRTGWVRHNGRTIGSATSGADERANADCQALFEFLWNTYADAKCPVVSGRGANAAADWASNKKITTISLRGVGPIGLDDMGNSAASHFTGVPFTDGNATTAASIAGGNAHTLTVAESPIGLHTYVFTDEQHLHGGNFVNAALAGGTTPVIVATNAGAPAGGNQMQPAFSGIISTFTDNAGGGTHNNLGLSITGTWFVKL
jgi:hypothetical protein